MNVTPSELKFEVAKILNEIKEIRSFLHQYPELSFKEYHTAKFISRKLTEWGIAHTSGVAETGTIVLIEGLNPSVRTIALRADIDALPILELNDVPYKSKNDGVMHACGHDVHTSCLLGAVKILHQFRNRFSGTIKAIFQPGEELLPGSFLNDSSWSP